MHISETRMESKFIPHCGVSHLLSERSLFLMKKPSFEVVFIQNNQYFCHASQNNPTCISDTGMESKFVFLVVCPISLFLMKKHSFEVVFLSVMLHGTIHSCAIRHFPGFWHSHFFEFFSFIHLRTISDIPLVLFPPLEFLNFLDSLHNKTFI